MPIPDFGGMRIIESRYLEQDGEPVTVHRTWRQRVWSWPWRPFQRTYTVVPKVPYAGALQIDTRTLVMHPDTVRRMRAQLESR